MRSGQGGHVFKHKNVLLIHLDVSRHSEANQLSLLIAGYHASNQYCNIASPRLSVLHQKSHRLLVVLGDQTGNVLRFGLALQNGVDGSEQGEILLHALALEELVQLVRSRRSL